MILASFSDNHTEMPQMSVLAEIRTKTKRLMNKVALVVLNQNFHMSTSGKTKM